MIKIKPSLFIKYILIRYFFVILIRSFFCQLYVYNPALAVHLVHSGASGLGREHHQRSDQGREDAGDRNLHLQPRLGHPLHHRHQQGAHGGVHHMGAVDNITGQHTDRK